VVVSHAAIVYITNLLHAISFALTIYMYNKWKLANREFKPLGGIDVVVVTDELVELVMRSNNLFSEKK
jgi:hypothetical protein